MEALLPILIQQVGLDGGIKDAKPREVKAAVTLNLKDGTKSTIQTRVSIDRGRIIISGLPYDPGDIHSISIRINRKGDGGEQPPRLMAWVEGSVPVDTTVDEWKDTTVDAGGTPITITKMLGTANVGTYDVIGKMNVGSPYDGIVGFTAGNGYSGIWGIGAADSTEGIRGEVLAGYNYSTGVLGVVSGAPSTDGSNTAVHGEAQGASTEYASGVVGIRVSGTTYTVYVNNGVYGYSDVGAGVVGFRNSGGTAVAGGIASLYTVESSGVVGYSGEADGNGVVGLADGGGSSSSAHTAVLGYDMNSTDNSYAVFSFGDFAATGGKSFIMDHPLDPANKFLKHYSMESNEILNVYRGTVQLDASGEAVVYLPEYFEAINTDFSYQLTPVGAPMPDLYVKQEISGNRFVIAGGKPGMKVSWTVYARRNDPYIRHHRDKFRDVVEKPARWKGKYLYPEFYGRSKAESIIQPEEENQKRKTIRAEWKR